MFDTAGQSQTVKTKRRAVSCTMVVSNEIEVAQTPTYEQVCL